MKKNSPLSNRLFMCLLFCLPAIVILIVFFLFPMIRALYVSFSDWDGISPDAKWVGLENFKHVVVDKAFKQIVFNTVYLMIIYVPVLNIVALLLAVGVYNAGKMGNIYKSVLFFPNMLSMTVVGFIWKLIYTYGDGIINKFLRSVGLKALASDWLGRPDLVLPSMSVTIIWFAVGYYLLIYLSGLYNIPVDLYEAADVEGTKGRQKFFYITVPLIAPAITINVILSTIGLITLFDLPYVLTAGGPGFKSQTLALQIYYLAFKNLQPKYALALAIILGIFTGAVTLILLKLLRKRETALA